MAFLVFQNVGNTKIYDTDIICIFLLKGNVVLVIHSLLLWNDNSILLIAMWDLI